MENQNNYIKTHEISNKWKKIYTNFIEYQSLNEAQQQFFDTIFPILWFEDKCNYRNSFFSDRYGYSESYIEKLLRTLSRERLIYREYFKEHNDKTGVWQTRRTLSLDPEFKVKMCQQLKLIPNSIQEELASTIPQNEENKTPEEDHSPEVPITKKTAPKKFNFNKIKR